MRRFGLYHVYSHKNALKRYVAISTFMAQYIYGHLRGPGPGPFTPSTPFSTVLIVDDGGSYTFWGGKMLPSIPLCTQFGAKSLYFEGY